MRDPSHIARRLATGLPAWAVARDCAMPLDELDHLMWEPRFREMVGAWEKVFALSPERRTERLVRLAHLILEDALARRDLRAVLYVDRESRRRRHPVESLARSFSNIVEHERARAMRQQAAIDAAAGDVQAPQPAAVPPAAVPPAAVPPAADRAPPHPVDRALSRKATELRREMFDGLVVGHAVEEEERRRLRLVPVEPHELPGWRPAEEVPMEEAGEAVGPEAAELEPVEPEIVEPEPTGDERDLAAEAAARRALVATMARLAPDLRDRVMGFPPEVMRRFILDMADGSFPGLAELGPDPDVEGDAQPQAP